jgi:O-antigen ligase
MAVLPWLLVGAAVVPSIALPFGVPGGFQFGGRQVFWADPLIPAAAFLAVRRLPGVTRRCDRWLTLVAFVVVGGMLYGISRGVGFSDLTQDCRGLTYLLCAYLIGSRVGLDRGMSIASRLVLIILPLTAAALVAGEVRGASLLQGRQSIAAAFVAGGPSQIFDVTRYMLPPKTLAAMSLVVGLALVLSGRQGRGLRRAGLWLVIASSVVVVFNSYSRSVLLGLAASVVVLLLLRRRAGLKPMRLALLGASVALVSWLLIFVPFGIADTSGNLLQRQVFAFNGRVVHGLEETNLSQSPGDQWRLVEGKYATEAIMRSPAFGLGLGTEYRPAQPVAHSAFSGNKAYGQQFIHNAVLFLLVKLGFVGTACLCGLALACATGALRAIQYRAPEPVPVALVAALVGVVTCSMFVPDLTNQASAGLVGLSLGMLAHRGAVAPSRTSTAD